MKLFNELSSDEIKLLSKEEYNEYSPFEKKSCGDCKHIVGYVNLWCNNADAIVLRGTSIPGIVKCPYWKPDWKHIDKKYKIPENGYKTFWQKIAKML